MKHVEATSLGLGRRAIAWLVTAALLAAAVICLMYGIKHSSHIAQGLGLLLVLACPLMHLFGHRHGGHHHSAEAPRPSDSTPRRQG